ncbi:hypothetical protein P43SY_010500 [Pythium insidiosum]|uniref:Uncharacterized protein n=1 Tax=Pythium insidiosum TaxID=114742 RepID=A0AAD5LYQ1_PYTIN|nr:hypothetical protein P43SY_010500 [Pythium insidiosum]
MRTAAMRRTRSIVAAPSTPTFMNYKVPITSLAVGSLGDGSDRAAFLELPAKLPQLQYIGLGVTESGLCANSPVIRDLAAFLWRAMQALPNNKLSVINTDNVPNNGALIKRYAVYDELILVIGELLILEFFFLCL